MNEPTFLRPLVEVLTDHPVRFVIVGGVAVSLHGLDRASDDLDVCYARDRENLEVLAKALAPLHPKVRGAEASPFTLDAPALRRGLNFSLQTDAGPLDLRGEVAGLGRYSEVDGLADQQSLFGRRVLVLGLDGLVRAKRAAGRAQDLADLTLIESSKTRRST
jgi:hypothetical protein